MKYVRWCEQKGHPLCQNWENFQACPRRKRPPLMHVLADSELVSAYGTFEATFFIEAIELHTNILVTYDQMTAPILLGRDLWDPYSIDSLLPTDRIRQEGKSLSGTSDISEGGHVTSSFKLHRKRARATPGRVLIDTGAAVSCMSMAFFRKMGGKNQLDLADTPAPRLMAANENILPSVGFSNPVEFVIDRHQCSMLFAVVETLGNDEVILGRDWLRKYDVLVDVPRGDIQVRNPLQNYHTKVIRTVARKIPGSYAYYDFQSEIQPNGWIRILSVSFCPNVNVPQRTL
ncbi:MAG: retroviral-like aspartic protease [Planctomycetaceae bacterium]|nr:retroviral-like aspartic protease [Planctomycetaceae bacterium]